MSRNTNFRHQASLMYYICAIAINNNKKKGCYNLNSEIGWTDRWYISHLFLDTKSQVTIKMY